MRNKLILLGGLSLMSVFGSNVPNINIGTIENQMQLPKDLPFKEKELVKIGGVDEYAPIMNDDKSGKKFFVKDFKLTHNYNIKEEILQKILTPFKNKELSFNELLDATSAITKEYRNRGYFVARAYLPKQNIKENIIEISVIEGYYGEFQIDNNSTTKSEVIQGIFDNSKKIEESK